MFSLKITGTYERESGAPPRWRPDSGETVTQRKQVPKVNKSQRSERLIGKQNVLPEANSKQPTANSTGRGQVCSGPDSPSPIPIPALSLLREKKKPSHAYPRNASAFFPTDSISALRPRSLSEHRPFYNFAQATSGYLCRCGVFALSRDDKHRSKECCCAVGSPHSVCASRVSLLLGNKTSTRMPRTPSAPELQLCLAAYNN